MGEKGAIIIQLTKVKKNISKDFPVDRMIFFGSRATGSSCSRSKLLSPKKLANGSKKLHKWSDIDLIIVSRRFKNMDFIERGAKMYDYWNLNYPADFLCYTPDEFKARAKKISIVSEAIKTGIEVKDAA